MKCNWLIVFTIIVLVCFRLPAQTNSAPRWKDALHDLLKNDSVSADSVLAFVVKWKEIRKGSASAHSVVFVTQVSANKSNDSTSPFEDHFRQITNLPIAKIDSIEETGITSATKGAMQKAKTLLEEERNSNITFVYGFAYKPRDLNFFLPKILNNYNIICTKYGVSVNEDRRLTMIKLMVLADTMPDRIITRKEIIAVNKKIAALVTSKVNDTDTLSYKRIPIPSDESVREVMGDEKSKIELLPGGFKTTYLQKMLIDRRIAELRDTGSLEVTDYQNAVKRISHKLDTNRDRILTDEEVRKGIVTLMDIP